MKNVSGRIFLGGFFCVLFISCASQSARIPPEREPEAISKPEAVIIFTPMESAVRRVKENSPLLKKYFTLDKDRNVIVKAETEDFEVIYDMKNSTPDGSGGFSLSFTLTSLSSGESRQDTLSWKPERNADGILLAFDDDYLEAWENNFDLFDHYGAKVTFFVQGEYSSFCGTALKRGHDVGYHSWNHLNLPKVSREVFRKETLSRIPAFRDAGVPLDSFAYPFGLSEEWMHEELLKTFRILRGYGVTFRVYDAGIIRQGYISSRALDNILFKTDEEFKAAIDIMFRTLKFTGGNLVLPLTSHDISDNAAWGIKPGRLVYLLQSVNDMRLNFYVYRDFIEGDRP
jgi:hypothetical protein